MDEQDKAELEQLRKTSHATNRFIDWILGLKEGMLLDGPEDQQVSEKAMLLGFERQVTPLFDSAGNDAGTWVALTHDATGLRVNYECTPIRG